MKTRVKLFLFSIFVLTSWTAMADLRIAVVDIDRAIIASDYAKTELKKLQEDTTFKANLDKYSQLREQLQSHQKEASANNLTWSSGQKQDFKKELEGKLTDLNKLGQQLDQQRLTVERNIQQQLSPKIKQIMDDMIKEKQLSMLLRSDSLHYRKPEHDLTQELLERLNKAQ